MAVPGRTHMRYVPWCITSEYSVVTGLFCNTEREKKKSSHKILIKGLPGLGEASQHRDSSNIDLMLRSRSVPSGVLISQRHSVIDPPAATGDHDRPVAVALERKQEERTRTNPKKSANRDVLVARDAYWLCDASVAFHRPRHARTHVRTMRPPDGLGGSWSTLTSHKASHR